MLAAALCGLARSLVPGDARQGLRVAAAASAAHGRLGSHFAKVWEALLEETRAEAIARLGPSVAPQIWESGLRLSITEAAGPGDRQAVPTLAAGLTRREAQVARLVAEGLSNRAVAERLHVSERTAEAHVLHILNKLGLTSRSQVAPWLYQESSTN
jgi:non-specific serine/threonine protein kinase